jgi:hypothetical protein
MKQAPVQLPRLEEWGSQAVRKNAITARYNMAPRLKNGKEISYKQSRKLCNFYNNVTVWNPLFCLFFEKGPEADATDALQPSGLCVWNPLILLDFWQLRWYEHLYEQ